MYVRQLGNGGGLSFKQANSNFIIKDDKQTILFDCGYNFMYSLSKTYKTKEVFNQLLEKIDFVFISHIHEDHMGNLKTFIAYKKFIINGKKVKIICGKKVKKVLKVYLKEELKQKWCVLIDDKKFNKRYSKNITINTIKVTHVVPTYGCLFKDNKENTTLFISADTIVDKKMEKKVLKLTNNNPTMVYHDCTEHKSKAHAYKQEIQDTYTNFFTKNMVYYHTRKEDYNKKYIHVKNKESNE